MIAAKKERQPRRKGQALPPGPVPWGREQREAFKVARRARKQRRGITGYYPAESVTKYLEGGA